MIPFVGPAYSLDNRKASAQDCINMHLVAMETAAKSQFVLESVPGLVRYASLGETIRGELRAGTRAFVVAGQKLYELLANGTREDRGTLVTSTGPVGMAWGLTQLVIVDGPNGYVFRLATNTFERITDPDWPGSNTVGFLNGYFTLIRPGTQQAYVTAIDDATNIDALDFVSAERVPDDTIGQICVFGEWWMLGRESSEIWTPPAQDGFPFQRNNGANIEIGCVAPHSVKAFDNGFAMIGQDKNGAGMVYRSNGLQLVRISTRAVEQALQASTALEDAVAYTYQHQGLTFWCVNAPGVPETWCYEVSTGTWHKRCDWANGEWTAGRINHVMYAHGMHLCGDSTGEIYRYDWDTHTNAGDPLVRERSSPNSVTPARERVQYPRFVMDCTTGEAALGVSPQVELSWSNDGGQSFSNPVLRSLGETGERFPRVVWHRLGMSRDRVWKVRFSGDAPFSIISAEAA